MIQRRVCNLKIVNLAILSILVYSNIGIHAKTISLLVSWSDKARNVRNVASGPNIFRIMCEPRKPYETILSIHDVDNTWKVTLKGDETRGLNKFRSWTNVTIEKEQMIFKDVPQNRSYKYSCEYRLGRRLLETPEHCIQDVRRPTCGPEVDSLPEVYSKWRPETYVFDGGEYNLTCNASERFYVYVDDKPLSLDKSKNIANAINSILDFRRGDTSLSNISVHNCTTEKKNWCFAIRVFFHRSSERKFNSSVNIRCRDWNSSVVLQTTLVVAPKPLFNDVPRRNNMTVTAGIGYNSSLCEIVNVEELRKFGFEVSAQVKVGGTNFSDLSKDFRKHIQLTDNSLIIKKNNDISFKKLINEAKTVTKEICLLSHIEKRVYKIQCWNFITDLPKYRLVYLSKSSVIAIIALVVTFAAVIMVTVIVFVLKRNRRFTPVPSDDTEASPDANMHNLQRNGNSVANGNDTRETIEMPHRVRHVSSTGS